MGDCEEVDEDDRVCRAVNLPNLRQVGTVRHSRLDRESPKLVNFQNNNCFFNEYLLYLQIDSLLRLL